MLRHARTLGRTDLLRIAVSSRTLVELPYAMELMDAGALIVLTREPYGDRAAARLMGDELRSLWEPGHTAYVCGSPRFAAAIRAAGRTEVLVGGRLALDGDTPVRPDTLFRLASVTKPFAGAL